MWKHLPTSNTQRLSVYKMFFRVNPDGMHRSYCNYNIMARSSHAMVRDGHISRLTLAMYWNTFIKIVFGGLSDPLLK